MIPWQAAGRNTVEKEERRTMTQTIAVIGSIVVDLPLILPRPAISGETLKVRSPGLNLGGKAVNQGLQALICGAQPVLVGTVGQDALADWVRSELARFRLSAAGVGTADAPTSCAVPIIEASNQYILHVPGANAHVTPADIDASHPLWKDSRWLLVQGEIPAEASARAAELMHQQQGTVICDPAPAGSMTPELLRQADVLTPNAEELRVLSGVAGGGLREQVERVWEAYPGLSMLIVTLGAQGVWFQERGKPGRQIPPPAVEAVDPTAAGDAFNGALVAALASGSNPLDACTLGCCAGALAATAAGSAKSLAPREAVIALWRATYRQ